ncbi:hypothetical protein [Segatella bryantii]|uniref:hypothetical protein n=1 Tax=Segatella bryantii TaxID=77095 RepID=UPI0024332CF6|nr:hypothetical protein [Segatella bryantii]
MREINIGDPEQLSNSERMLYNIANNSSIKTDPPNSRVEKLLEQIMANSGSSALKFIGITTTEIEDESTTSPVVINGEEVIPDNGDIVFYIKGEYVWDGSKWRLLGDNITYAYYTENTTAQTAVFSGQKHFEIIGDAQYPNTFSNDYNIAFGPSNTVKGNGAFAVGSSNNVSGEYAMAQGINSYATGAQSHAEGRSVNAVNAQAHAEGQQTTASGAQSHAEGYVTQAVGAQSHAEGNSTHANGSYAHTEGQNSTAAGEASHAEGHTANAVGKYSHAEGDSTTAPGLCSHAEGYGTYSIGNDSHAEGDSCYSPGQAAHAEGAGRYAVGHAAHAEGVGNGSVEIKGEAAHAEGYYTKTDGTAAHAEGYQTSAMAQAAHAEGYSTTASGSNSHAEGYQTTASGHASHAEGHQATVSGSYSHVEGYNNTINTGADYSHAEGYNNTINSYMDNSHAEGGYNVINGSYSHVGGFYNIAGSNYQTVIGKFNESDTNDIYSFIVGNGTGDNNRRNGFTVKWDGTAQVGALPVNDMDVATKKYVDDNSATVHHSASTPTTADGKNGDIWYKMSVGTLGELEEIIAEYTKYNGAWYENKDNNTTYTAGENINIDSNNVISATISGGTSTPFVMVNNSTTSQHWEASLPNVTSISTGFTILVANMGSGVYTSEVVDFNLTYNNSDSTGAVPVYVSKGTGVSEQLLAGNTTAPEVFMLMFFKANEYSINGTVQNASKWIVVGIS